MTEWELGPGAEVHVAPPVLPEIRVAPPPTGQVVVPVAGPPGQTGPMGGDPTEVQNMIDTAVGGHAAAPEPHPVYDDLQSLTLLFENRLV